MSRNLVHLQSDLAGRTHLAELGPTHIAAHGRKAPVPGVAHDLLVRHSVAVSRCDGTGPQTMRANRLGPGARDARLSHALEQDLVDGIGAQATKLDRAASVDLAKDRSVGIRPVRAAWA